MDRVYAAVLESVGRYGMIRRGDTVVVGVSGGVDSMCLLDLLWRMRGSQELSLVVAHLHHGMRGDEADRDALLVEERAACYGLPFEGGRLTPDSRSGGGNVQAWARQARHGFLERTAARWSARRIATGHHRDDHVETLLMQLFRGTGSLRGILAVRDERYVRPLIHVGREELVGYARDRGIPYREDASNRSPVYLRNRIRAELVPWIRDKVNPSFDRALVRFSTILRDESDCLDRLARDALDRAVAGLEPRVGVLALHRHVLEGLHPALFRRVVRMACARIEGSAYGLSWDRVEAVRRSLDRREAAAHRRFPLHGGVHLFVEYQEVLLSRQDVWAFNPYCYPLVPGEFLPIPEASAGIECSMSPCGLDAGVVPAGREEAFLAWAPGGGDLVVRNARPGDRFRPEGAGGEKKLKEYFIDQKIPRSLRARIPILEIGGTIAWVAGQRRDERFRPGGGAASCIHVRLTAGPEGVAERFQPGK